MSERSGRLRLERHVTPLFAISSRSRFVTADRILFDYFAVTRPVIVLFEQEPGILFAALQLDECELAPELGSLEHNRDVPLVQAGLNQTAS